MQPVVTDSKSARDLIIKNNKKFNNASRNSNKQKQLKSEADHRGENNRLKDMKKFYPEEYFRRSGYPFDAMNKKKQRDMVYFNKKAKKNDAEFNRFNEELVYPTTESKAGGDTKSQIRRYDLDRLSAVSRQSRTPMGEALSR